MPLLFCLTGNGRLGLLARRNALCHHHHDEDDPCSGSPKTTITSYSSHFNQLFAFLLVYRTMRHDKLAAAGSKRRLTISRESNDTTAPIPWNQ